MSHHLFALTTPDGGGVAELAPRTGTAVFRLDAQAMTRIDMFMFRPPGHYVVLLSGSVFVSDIELGALEGNDGPRDEEARPQFPLAMFAGPPFHDRDHDHTIVALLSPIQMSARDFVELHVTNVEDVQRSVQVLASGDAMVPR